MKLISLEDEYDKMGMSPLYPEKKSGCSSCGKKGININITNTANGNTASGNANNDNANTLTSSQPATASRSTGINRVEKQPVIVRDEPQPATDRTITILDKILEKLNEPRPLPSSIATEKKPDNVKVFVKDREVIVPVERKVNYVKPQEININRDRTVPYVHNQENTVERERIKTDVIEREVPRFFDRVKNKVLVIRANQPPAPPSFA